MGSELLKMADGFALVVDSLRELAGQAVEEAEAETKQESRTEKGIADKNTAGVKANKKKEGTEGGCGGYPCGSGGEVTGGKN